MVMREKEEEEVICITSNNNTTNNNNNISKSMLDPMLIMRWPPICNKSRRGVFLSVG